MPVEVLDSPWLRAEEGGRYAKCSKKLLYRAVAAGRLRAARLDGRRDLRFRREWIDQWLTDSAAIVEVRKP